MGASRHKVRLFAAVLTGVMVSFLTLIAQHLWQGYAALNSEDFPSNLNLFLLINLLIVVLMFLVFLVARNIVKLFLDRRRKILGAKLRSRLVFAFVVLALVPTALLFFVSRGIVGSVLQTWFSPQVAALVEDAFKVANYHYSQIEADLTRRTDLMAAEVLAKTQQSTGKLLETRLPKNLENFEWLSGTLSGKLSEYQLAEIAIISQGGEVLFQLRSTSSVPAIPINLNSVVESLHRGSAVLAAEEFEKREFLRGYRPLFIPSKTLPQVAGEIPSPYLLVVAFPIDAEIGKLMASVNDAHEEYQDLRRYRRLVGQSYLLMLLAVTFFVIVAAVWVGFYLARTITDPIQSLASGTQQIARGNLEYRIPELGDDELSILVRSFNKMTEDLQHTTGELESRRRYMEAVLASVGVGVISLDHDLRLRTCNTFATELLGLEFNQDLVSRKISEFLPPQLITKLQEMLTELGPNAERVATANVSLFVRGHTRQIQITSTKLINEAGDTLGAVVLLDDLTELVSAQRIAAWQEVARRLAHEFKNPLTPIQLSAQRIQRRLAGKGETAQRVETDRELIRECTETIVKQVEVLRNLVNEFSQFARMPRSQPEPVALVDFVEQILPMFREAHPQIAFEVRGENALPMIEVDREQLTRVVLNLLDNAVSAIALRVREQRAQGVEPDRGQIVVDLSFNAGTGMVAISIGDNGVGVPEADRTQIFEPYYSTKTGGTGLGLSIVSTIVEEHRGFIRVRDNSPRGALFTIELPYRAQNREVGNS